MAHTFFWKHDDNIDRQCAMLAGIVKSFIAAAFAVLAAIAAPVAAPVSAGVGAALEGTEGVLASTATKSSPYTMAALKMVIKDSSWSQVYWKRKFSPNPFLVHNNREKLVFVNLFKIPREMKNYFKNAVISVILEEQMWYIQCSSTKSKSSDRSSFEPEPGRFCEAKCWRNWKGEKTLKMFGLDELVKKHNDWDLEIQEFLRASYGHYKANGLGQGQMLPSIGTLFEDKLKSTSGSFLPVCDSRLTLGANSIPCMCGDEYGSETEAFWNETNFASWDASRSEGLVEKSENSPAYLCMAKLAEKKVLPVPYFLNLCNMGTHWPFTSEHSLMDDKGNYLVKGRGEISSDAFQGSVDIWHRKPADLWSGQYDALDENCYMCYYSDVGQLLKNEQETKIQSLCMGDGVFRYNFAQACREMRHARKFPGGDLRHCRSPNFPNLGECTQ
ncbi:MAG: hypothetical protein Q9200_005045 [Gallowayella weberi]